MSVMCSQFNRNVGFFDIGNLGFEESESSVPSVFPNLFLTKHCDETIGKLNVLHSFAKRKNHALVIIGHNPDHSFQQDDQLIPILSIPFDKGNHSWKVKLRNHAVFCIEKKAESEKKSGCDNYGDVFRLNENVMSFFTDLGIMEWVVFGDAADDCVNAAINGLLHCNLGVIKITDISDGKVKNAPFLTDCNAREMTCDQFLSYYFKLCSYGQDSRPQSCQYKNIPAMSLQY
jgi:hypothetical protein